MGLKYGLMSSMPVLLNLSPLYITASRNSTESPSCPKVRFGWCLFRSVLSFSSVSGLSVHTTKMSSRYRFHIFGCIDCEYRKSSSIVAMKMFANVGATLVPIAVPKICLYILPAKLNILCSRIILKQF